MGEQVRLVGGTHWPVATYAGSTAWPVNTAIHTGGYQDRCRRMVGGTTSAAMIHDASRAQRRVAVLLIDAQYYNSTTGAPWATGENIPHEKNCMEYVLNSANRAQHPVYEIVWPGLYETDPQLARQRWHNWIRVEKFARSAFTARLANGLSLAEDLRARGITDLVLMGLYSEQCVLETAMDAIAQGFHVHTSPDVVQGHQTADLVPWYSQNTRVGRYWRDLPIAWPT